MSVIAVLQARCSSTRLPGKVLQPILGFPMLARQIERVKRARNIDKLVVATSVDSSDDPIGLLCKQWGVACFRGDLHNVLARFYHAVEHEDIKHLVRLTGDCPVIDPDIIDQVVTLHIRKDADYTSNTLDPTFPDGMDVEVMKYSVLKEVYKNARLSSQLEHVTLYIHQHPEKFKLISYQGSIDLSAYRLTVDEREDFQLITWIYEQLYYSKPDFGLLDILNLFKQHPARWQCNQKFKRNEGLEASLTKDGLLLNEGNKL